MVPHFSCFECTLECSVVRVKPEVAALDIEVETSTCSPTVYPFQRKPKPARPARSQSAVKAPHLGALTALAPLQPTRCSRPQSTLPTERQPVVQPESSLLRFRAPDPCRGTPIRLPATRHHPGRFAHPEWRAV